MKKFKNTTAPKIIAMILLMLVATLTLFSCKDADKTDPSDTSDTNDTSSDSTTVSSDESTPDVTTPQKKEFNLRVGSYNIANGKVVSHSMQIIANDILSLDLDIIGIQEVDRLATRSGYIDTMAELAKYTGYKYYYYTKAINIAGDVATYGQEGEYGTGILSKYPITFSESKKLESGGKEQRMLSHVKIDVDGVEINFYNTHLSYENSSLRKTQFEQLAETLKNEKLCFLTGDFNISSFGEFYVIKNLKMTNNHKNVLITFPSSQKYLDNILYSSEFTLKDSGVLDETHSDHKLLYAEFSCTIE